LQRVAFKDEEEAMSKRQQEALGQRFGFEVDAGVRDRQREGRDCVKGSAVYEEVTLVRNERTAKTVNMDETLGFTRGWRSLPA
jgi:hypothetical protein